MPAVNYSRRALDHLDRLFDFLAAIDPRAAVDAGETIIDAVRVLERHPRIGRPARGGMRELVVGFGRSGYLVLYRYLPRADRVDVLAIRHQREAGYA